MDIRKIFAAAAVCTMLLSGCSQDEPSSESSAASDAGLSSEAGVSVSPEGTPAAESSIEKAEYMFGLSFASTSLTEEEAAGLLDSFEGLESVDFVPDLMIYGRAGALDNFALDDANAEKRVVLTEMGWLVTTNVEHWKATEDVLREVDDLFIKKLGDHFVSDSSAADMRSDFSFTVEPITHGCDYTTIFFKDCSLTNPDIKELSLTDPDGSSVRIDKLQWDLYFGDADGTGAFNVPVAVDGFALENGKTYTVTINGVSATLEVISEAEYIEHIGSNR